MQIIIVLFEILLFYLIIIVTYQLLGKRKIEELSIMDLIIFIFVINIIALNIPLKNQSFSYTIIIVAFVIFLQMFMTFMSSLIPVIRYMYNGKGALLIKKGKLNFKDMLRKRYNLDELLIELKEKSIKRIEDVDYAVLENNGKLFTFNHVKDNNVPLPIIIDGKIEQPTLKILHKDIKWINNLILKENTLLENVFYAFYKQGKIYIIKNK
jgi:uncharacterized membrane protein YcaP (DUF421 family)